jgi:PEGA domain
MGLVVLSGCGFLLHGEKQDITFDSKPPGVTVTLDNATQFTTPHTIALTRASNHQALFKKEGYETQPLSIRHEFLIGSAIIGNILPFFPVGLAVDVMTGAAWGFERDYLAVDMTKSQARP